MARYVMHLIHKNGDGRWHLQAKGRTIIAFDTKVEAEKAGQKRGHELQDVGQDTQLIAHRQDGSIEHEFIFDHDPEPHPG
jgi:hypothetical protein